MALQGWENWLGQAAGNFWAAQQRRQGVGPVRVAVIGGNGVITILEPERLRILVGIRVNSRMELAEEMLAGSPGRRTSQSVPADRALVTVLNTTVVSSGVFTVMASPPTVM